MYLPLSPAVYLPLSLRGCTKYLPSFPGCVPSSSFTMCTSLFPGCISSSFTGCIPLHLPRSCPSSHFLVFRHRRVFPLSSLFRLLYPICDVRRSLGEFEFRVLYSLGDSFVARLIPSSVKSTDGLINARSPVTCDQGLTLFRKS